MDINYYKKFEPIDGKWYINKVLGSGAYGTVFEIERKDFSNMKSALKVISIPSSQSEFDSFKEDNYSLDEQSINSYYYSFVEEFVKEFQLMSQLKGHSNIVSYEDHNVIAREDGIGWDIFIRMELLTPMNKYFSSKPPHEKDIIKIGIDICKALEICKKYNIIHRDIKASNIFVSDAGDFKLGDFGVARTLEKNCLSQKGTYTYMAPEIFKGDEYGPTVDIYSLGIVLYKLLNNNYEPFRNDISYSSAEKAISMRIRGAEIPAPENTSPALSKIVLKACSFKPEDRYQDPAQMREDLENLLREEKENKSIQKKTYTKIFLLIILLIIGFITVPKLISNNIKTSDTEINTTLTETHISDTDYELLNFGGNYSVIVMKEDNEIKYGLIDSSGYIIIPVENYYIKLLSDGYYKVWKNKNDSPLLYKNGKICDEKYNKEDKTNFYNLRYENNSWIYTDNEGNELYSEKYEFTDTYCDNLIKVKYKNQYGYIDNNYNTIISCKYDEISKLVNGMAYVKKDNKEYVIDKNEKIMYYIKK